ncbi:MAG: helix-turn-helix transcriptional regulator [Lachnospiraceae bacterium]|nr:helix-turn-helix transcriptional regulator [Lachnospiraceae bacterium]
MGATVFSTKIRKLRKDAGYTQDKVSRMLNIQRQTYSNYENALRVPPLEIIVALSGIYHVTLDSLLLDQMPVIASDGSELPSPERDQLLSGYTDLSEPKRREVLEFIEFKKQLPD